VPLFEGDPHTAYRIGLAPSDPSQLPALRDWMRGLADIEVTMAAGTPEPGELGSLDVLSILAGSGGLLVTALKTLPDFIRARRSSFRIETTVRGEKLVLDASNVDEFLPILERLLDD
jgi:Effector Associated Constant Component 1